MIKEGKLFGLKIWLIDPNVAKKDIVCPSYFSEPFHILLGDIKMLLRIIQVLMMMVGCF
jgi:hypothetical protein